MAKKENSKGPMGRRIGNFFALFERAKRKIFKNDSANNKKVTAEQVSSDKIKSDINADTAKQVGSNGTEPVAAAYTAKQVSSDKTKADINASTAKHVPSNRIKADVKADTVEQLTTNGIKPYTAANTKSKDDTKFKDEKAKLPEGLTLADKDNLKKDTTITPDLIIDREKEQSQDEFITKKLEGLCMREQKADKLTSIPDPSDEKKHVEKKLNDDRKKDLNKEQLLVKKEDLSNEIEKKYALTNKNKVVKDSTADNSLSDGAAKEKDHDDLVKELGKLSINKHKVDRRNETKSDEISAKADSEHRESAETKEKSEDGSRKTLKDPDTKSNKDKINDESVQKIRKDPKSKVRKRARGGHDRTKKIKDNREEQRNRPFDIKDRKSSIKNTVSTDIDALIPITYIPGIEEKDKTKYESVLSRNDEDVARIHEQILMDLGNNVELPDITELTNEEFNAVVDVIDNSWFLQNLPFNGCYEDDNTDYSTEASPGSITSSTDSPQNVHAHQNGMDIDPNFEPQNVVNKKTKSNKPGLKQIQKQQEQLIAKLNLECCGREKSTTDLKLPEEVADQREMAPMICKVLEMPLEASAFSVLEDIMRTISAGKSGKSPITDDAVAKLYSLMIHIANRIVGQRPDLFLEPQAAELLEVATLLCDNVPFFLEFLLSRMRVAVNEVKKKGIKVDMPIFRSVPDKVSQYRQRIEKFKSLYPNDIVQGDTLLHILSRIGKADMLQEILMDSIMLFDINAKNDEDFTALHEAVRCHKDNRNEDPNTWLRIVHLLLKHGKADCSIIDARGGETAAHMALDDFNMMLVIIDDLKPGARNAFSKIRNRFGVSLVTAAKKLTQPNQDVINFLVKCKPIPSKTKKENGTLTSSPSASSLETNESQPSSMSSPLSNTDQFPFINAYNSPPMMSSYSDANSPPYLQAQPTCNQSQMYDNFLNLDSPPMNLFSSASITPNQTLSFPSPQPYELDQYNLSSNPPPEQVQYKESRYTTNLSHMCAGLVHSGSLSTNNQSPLLNNQSPLLNNQSQLVNIQSQLVNNQSPLVNNQSQLVNNKSQLVNNQSPLLNNQSQLVNNQSPLLNNQSMNYQSEMNYECLRAYDPSPSFYLPSSPPYTPSSTSSYASPPHTVDQFMIGDRYCDLMEQQFITPRFAYE